jgi:photosystem II stability/assembly factor-like uncharacterized protein
MLRMKFIDSYSKWIELLLVLFFTILRRMHRTRQNLLIIVLFLSCCGEASDALAQSSHWRKIFQGTPQKFGWMHSGFFFNRDFGLICGVPFSGHSDSSILRTTNGGTSWNTPLYFNLKSPNGLGGSMVFRDSLNGWTDSPYSDLSGYDHNALGQTTDGGMRWNFTNDSVGNLIDSSMPRNVSISPTGKLFQSGGAIAFQDALHGIACITFHPIIFEDPIKTTSRTTDGGITWTPINVPGGIPQWIIYQPKTKTYLLSRETDQPTRLAVTNDFGNTWVDIPDTVNPAYCLLWTSDGQHANFLAGTTDLSFIQTCRVFRSADGGVSWKNVNGPYPYHNGYYGCILVPPKCHGSVIIAFGGYPDSNAQSNRTQALIDSTVSAYMTTDGGDGTIPLPGDTLTIVRPKFDSVFACDTTRLPLMIANCGCTPADYHFDSVIVANDVRGEFKVENAKIFPKQWDGFASRDTLWVSYAPNFRIGASSALVHLYGRIIRDGVVTPFDSLIPLSVFAKVEALSVIPSEDSIDLGRINLCFNGVDTLVRITNRSCGSVLIDSSWTLGAEFDLSTIKLPFMLAHDSSIVVRIHSLPATPGLKKETLHFHASSGGASETITINLLATAFKASSGLLLSNNKIDFGSQTLCAYDSAQIGLIARGCDSLHLDSVRYSGDADFSTASSTGLATPTDSTHATIYIHPATSGAHTGTVTIFSHDLRDGSEHDTTIAIAASVMPPGREIATTTTGLFPVAICNVDSTLITVSNTGCDTLIFDPAQLTGAGYSFTTNDPITVPPGHSMHYVVRLNPVAKGQQAGLLAIRAHDAKNASVSQDTVIALTAQVLDGRRFLSIDSTLRDFGSGSLCRSADTTIVFKNTGCDSLTVSAIAIVGSNAMTAAGRTTPFVLPPDSSTSISVHYVPAALGPDQAILTITTNADQSRVVNIPIRALAVGPQSLKLLTSVSKSNIHAGDTTTIFVTPDRAVSVAGLTTLSCSISYDGDLLTYVSAASVQPEFVLASPIENRTGKTSTLTLNFTTTNPVTTFASTPMAAIKLRTTLTDSLRTAISIGDIKLNNGDATFTKCVLAISDNTTNFTIALNCGDPTINTFLRKQTLALTAQPAYPDPITASNDFRATIPFITSTTGTARITIHDITGRSILQEEQPVSYAGKHFFYFTGERLPAGRYFYEIEFPKGEVIVSRTMLLAK